MRSLHVIYVPGLGERYVKRQKMLVDWWRCMGVKPQLFDINWEDDEPWPDKRHRLLGLIDSIVSDGDKVGLVGSSAGASAVIDAFAARKDSVVGCVVIAGKVNNPKNIHQKYRRNNPAFVEAAYECEKVLAAMSRTDRARIQSRYGLVDEVVSRADSKISGADNITAISFGHFATIASELVFAAPSFLGFLKRQAKARK